MNILGLIAGILGILGSGYTFIEAMNRPGTTSSTPIFVALISICLVIIGLIGATKNNKKSSILMGIGVIGGILIMIVSLNISNLPISFFIGIVVTILFFIGSVGNIKKKVAE